MRALHEWSIRRPLPRPLTEGALLAVLVGLAAVSAGLSAPDVGFSPAFAAGLAPLAVLWWRRDAPLVVFALTQVLAAGSRLLAGANGPAEMAVLVAIYTVATRRSAAWTAGAVAVDTVAMGLWLSIGAGSETLGIELAGQVFATVVAALLGLYVQSRRTTEQVLRERAERLDRERGLTARAAVEEERRRIARELHDVVAHHVSVMTLQSGALEKRLRRAGPASDPTLAELAGGIRETGQEAMSELRRMLGVMHREPGADGRSPQPDLSALELLAARMRDAGMPLDVEVRGPAGEVGAGMGLALYRIAQEALTNTLRHAGPVPTSLRVEVGADEVELRVRDRGRGAAGPPRFPPEATTGGHGILGMRERAALFGGTVEAAPHPEGGFEVRVRLARDATTPR